jgi:hypothetical protein
VDSLTDRLPLHATQHDTPIFDQLMAERDQRPLGSLTAADAKEMAAYAAQMAADPDPIVKGFEPTPPQVHVITVVPLREKLGQGAQATRLPDPEPIPLGDPEPRRDPEEPQEEPQDALEAPQKAEEDPEVPQEPEYLCEADTALLEPVAEQTQVMPVVEK